MITPTHEPSSFGAMLKAFRTRRHLTQRQLAEALGMHRHAILRWEQGEFLPAHQTLVLELATAFRLG
jgi:transcriptional regulator with XRE-family HTH domain